MKKVLIALGIAGLCVLSGGVYYLSANADGKPVEFAQVEEVSKDSYESAKKIALSELGLKKPEKVYDMDYQEKADLALQKLKKSKTYTMENPLFVMNPYGTNTLGLYAYFETDKAGVVEYTVHTEDSTDFTRVLRNNEGDVTVKEHEYQLIGLIPNAENIVVLRLLSHKGKVLEEHSFSITTGGLLSDTAPHIAYEDGESKEELENGLFAILGHDKSFNANIYMYDNDANIRSEIVLDGYRTDKIEFIDDKMLYSTGFNAFALVNRLGKVEEIYTMKGFKQHHDFLYDEDSNRLLVLANENKTDTIEDKVVEIDMDTNESRILLDMKDFFPEVYETGVQPEGGNTYGGDELDWIHLNTIEMGKDGDVILSAREISAIIAIKDVDKNPQIRYIIHGGTLFDGTDKESLLLKQEGSFTPQAGQHTVTYLPDDSLPAGQYYLYMYNNNFGSSRTRPDFNWDVYGDEVNRTYEVKEGQYSMMYQYLIDEKAGTYQLVDKVEVPYSSVVSSTQYVGNHLVTSSGMSNCYNEYDSEHKLIRQYNYSSEKYAYRVFKYDFNSIYFIKS